MNKKRIYIYLGVSVSILLASIILFVLDTSPAYSGWTSTFFILACVMTFGSLLIGLYQINHDQLTESSENMIEWFRFLGMSLMTVLIVFMFLLTSATVDGASMESTLENNDVVLIYHYSYEPKKNDIVIINITTDHYPNHKGEQDYYVKRIYGMPGDQVTFEYESVGKYKIVVNGVIVENQYSQVYYARTNENVTQMTYSSYSEKDMIESLLDTDNRIPEGYYLVFGDNELHSLDSRDLGLIQSGDIIGKVIYRLYPFGGIA